MKTLDTINKYHSGVSISTTNGKTTIMVDGKKVSPTSKKGKRIIEDANQKLSKMDSIIDGIMNTAEKAITSVTNLFN